MPPLGESGSLQAIVKDYIESNNVMVFSKSTCPFCKKVKNLFDSFQIKYLAVELDQMENGADIQATLKEMTGQRTVPNVFINKTHIGGCDDTLQLHKDGKLHEAVAANAEKPEETYDYDLIVIGGGSGGLAASKAAAAFNKKVAVFDFVKPTPSGTTWGLGGTCVNVGCIPKKLMHQAALLGEAVNDSMKYGWAVEETYKHNWNILRDAVQDHIGSLNFAYRVQLREKKITYVNAYAKFVGPHTIEAVNKKGKVTTHTSAQFLLAPGLRPNYLNCPGAKEYCITSDDLFALQHCPGKTLLVGASYISLECAGFLKAFGLDVTVMVRSILLRGFDRQMADLIGSYMESHGIRFIQESQVKKVEQLESGEPGRLLVTYGNNAGEESSEEFNTVVLAIGRQAMTDDLNLGAVGVKTNSKNGKIICDEKEGSSVPYIHAVGDVVDGKPELTPVAIQAGILLARRLFSDGSILCDYENVPTTVFTPLEYGCIGLSEEKATELYGIDDLEVYHTNYVPLEFAVAQRRATECYVKLICIKSLNEKVVGFHYAGPNAGEVTQGYAVAMRLGATKHDFDNTIGIHPTCSEVFTTLQTTKSSGMNVAAAGC